MMGPAQVVRFRRYGGAGMSSGAQNGPYGRIDDGPARSIPSAGGSGSRNGAGGTGNDAGWSTGIQDAFYGAQDDPWKGRLRDRIAAYVRRGSFDPMGMAGEPGGGA